MNACTGQVVAASKYAANVLVYTFGRTNIQQINVTTCDLFATHSVATHADKTHVRKGAVACMIRAGRQRWKSSPPPCRIETNLLPYKMYDNRI